MTDSGKETHHRLSPEADPTTDEKDEKQANRLAVGFALFIPIGIALGLTVFDNVGLGVAIGLGMGSMYSIVMGAASD